MSKAAELLRILNAMTDDQLYETGKLVSAIVSQRHALRAMEGKEIRPGKRGVPWKRADGTAITKHKRRKP